MEQRADKGGDGRGLIVVAVLVGLLAALAGFWGGYALRTGAVRSAESAADAARTEARTAQQRAETAEATAKSTLADLREAMARLRGCQALQANSERATHELREELADARRQLEQQPEPVPVAQAKDPADQLRAGMSLDDVGRILGEPARKTAAGTSEKSLATWTYDDGLEVHFQDGLLSTWKRRDPIAPPKPPQDVPPTPQERRQTRTVRIRAWITGNCQIVICGDTLRWVHYSYDRPGEGPGIKKPYATFINGRRWTPTWQGEQSAPIKLPFGLPENTADVKLTLTEVHVPGTMRVVPGKTDMRVEFNTRNHRGGWFEVVAKLEW